MCIRDRLPDDDRHRLDAQHLTRRQPTMAGDQLIAAVRQRPCQRRGDGSHLADALDHPLHLLVVLHLEGVTFEWVQLGQWNIPHPDVYKRQAMSSVASLPTIRHSSGWTPSVRATSR